eukprot:c25980_g1_i1 orf=143-1315(-)
MPARKLVNQEVDQLIPGLLNSVVQDCLLPRLPWHTRPVLKAVSKAWNAVLQIPASCSALTRQTTLVEGLVIVHQVTEQASIEYFRQVKVERWMPQPHALSIYDEEAEQWRRLPPIPVVHPLNVLHDCGIACVDRKLFVMGGWDPKTDGVSALVYMLDLGSGCWQWEKRCSMHTPKAFFYSKSMAGKIYVVGGSSSQSRTEEEPAPEVYDYKKDRWELLPKVSVSRLFHYNGLAAVDCKVLAFGFCTSERGDMVNFWRIYDPIAKEWNDWDCDLARCSSLLAGDHDLRDGVVNKLDAASRTWTPFDGKVCTKTWRWEGGKKVISDSTCAHGFFVVTECSRPHVYATICEGDNRCLTIWRGDIDYKFRRVTWRKLQLPGSLSMCSEMSYLED